MIIWVHRYDLKCRFDIYFRQKTTGTKFLHYINGVIRRCIVNCGFTIRYTIVNSPISGVR